MQKKEENTSNLATTELIKEILINELNLNDEKITDIKTIGGMTNKNFLVTINSQKYVFRSPGVGSDKLINRENEFKNINKISHLSIDSELFFFNTKNGIKISKYIENSITLSPMTVKENFSLIAKTLKLLHTDKNFFENEFDIFKEIDSYEKKINGNIENFYPEYLKTKNKILKIQEKLENDNILKVNCHNDTVAENFIKANNKIYLIDWEYSGLNEAEWDLAAFSLESSLSNSDEQIFLNYYYENNITEKNKEKILIYKILQDFLWSLWTIVKFENGVYFGEYGINRYNRCIKNLGVLKYV